jgi:hypothetical protein
MGGPGNYEILQAMRSSLQSLTPGGTGGSHTEVSRFDPALLREALEDLASRHGGDRSAARAQADAISNRFLVKVGNIHDYVIKLRNGGSSIIRRHLASEAFGPAGYSLAPTIDKVLTDTREAVREIPFFAFGTPEEQFAPDVLGQVRNAVANRHDPAGPDGTFLVQCEGTDRSRRSVFEVLEADPYFKAPIPDFEALTRFQKFHRNHPLDTVTTERLQAFFDAPMTVGFRDVLRYLEGARHPNLGWNRAADAIRRCYERFGTENFLPAEINYYSRSIEYDPGRDQAMEAGNREAAKAFARWLVERLPFSWTMPVSDGDLLEIAHSILETHFDYPIFEVEPYVGIISTGTMRLALRALMNATFHLGDVDVPERRNPISPALAERIRPVAAFLDGRTLDDRTEFLLTVNRMLWEVAVRQGIPDGTGGVLPFRRINRTFYSFQEKAQYPLSRVANVEEVMSLEELLEPQGRPTLERHPELIGKLTVFFVQAYKYFLDTGHVPDLRPDDAGMDLFVRGIWGYKTRNVLVATGTGPDGKPESRVSFVDNKDQFKQYRRYEDRGRPLGLVKYGLRLVYPVVQPAMERSIGLFVQRAADLDDPRPGEVPDLPKHAGRMTREVLRHIVDSGITHSSAILHDLIDDTSDALEAGLRNIPGRRKDR